MLVAGVQRGIHAKVHPDPTAHDLFSVHFLANSDGGIDIEEGDYDSAERFEGCPGVDCAVSVYRLAYLDKIRLLEDLRFNKVLDIISLYVVELSTCTYGDNQSIRRRRGLRERWQIGEVQREWRLAS